MKCITFNNLIPSYSMKLIQWHDVEGLEGVEALDEEQYLEEEDREDDEDELEEVASHVPNQVLQD